MNKIHVFTHSADLDGHCSGAIVKYKFPEAVVHGTNYGDKFPWDEIGPDDMVYMTDFCLQPFSDMIKLASLHGLIWIDHHKSAHDEYKANAEAFREVDMVVDESKAACELVWEYLFPDKPVPLAVHLLGRYDVWDHSDKRVLPFQMRMRMEDMNPYNPHSDHAMANWEQWFLRDHGGVLAGGDTLLDRFLKEGTLLLRYDEEQKRRYVKTYGFETWIHDPNSGDRLAMTLNIGHTNSKVFDSVWRKECPTCGGRGEVKDQTSDHIMMMCPECGNHKYTEPYDIMITFCRRTDRRWNVSLYSTKPDIDCGSIAKSFGGGGHKSAAGFQCEELPFDH